MPIYGNKLTQSQYKIVTKISFTDYKYLVETFKKSMNTFAYKYEKEFLSSIDIDEAYGKIRYVGTKYQNIYDNNLAETMKGKFPYIAKYVNGAKYRIDDYTYGLMMESLIKEACRYLDIKKSKYLIDITGSWTDGNVIIMEKK